MSAGDQFHEEAFESRWEAGTAIALVIALQVILTVTSELEGWEAWRLPWWIWLVPIVPEVMLLGTLAWSRPRRRLRQMGIRREASLTLLALLSLANGVLLLVVIASLVAGGHHSGAQLLLEGGTVWVTNVVAFGLWFWIVDRGGPIRREQPHPPPPDFQFPQLENPQLAEPGWHPRLLDYLYVSFTNSIAFSPTDAMPLTRRAKLLMLVQAAASALTVLLVAARAVNIFQ